MNLIEKLSSYNNLLIICEASYRQYLVDYYAKEKKLRNITYKTFREVANDLLGVYDDYARIELARDYEIDPELATTLLQNSLLVQKSGKHEISKELLEIKNGYAKYLNRNPLITNLYKNKKIVIINNYILNDEFSLAYKTLKSLNPDILEINTYQAKDKKIKVLEFENYKEEICNLLNQIGSLIEKKVDPKHIKVHMPANYYNYAKEIFNLANIDLNISESKPLSHYELTKNIIKDLTLLKELKYLDAVTQILDKYKNINNPIFDKIINIFNSYLKSDFILKDILTDLLYKFKSTKYKEEMLGGIKVCNIYDEVIKANDYVFILGLNQDVFPRTYKDDKYLLDYEREDLGLLLSSELNKTNIRMTLDLLKSIEYLYLSYANFSPDGSLIISSIVNSLAEEVEVETEKAKVNNLLSYSKKLSELELGKHLDLFYKYDVKSEELYVLNNQFPNTVYKQYDNSFTGISKELLNKYLEGGIILSYTAIDKYNKCGFLFYLENVLKIKRIGNESSLFIGSLIHEILYKVINETEVEDFRSFANNVVSEYVRTNKVDLTKKDEFFINKYINVLEELLKFIKMQTDNSEFKVFGLEKEFDLVLANNVRLNGKIDKILTFKVNNTNYAIVVDYKSGSTEFDLNRIIHGLNMQIMFYFYFLNYSGTEKYEFAGGYLQGILPNNPFGYLKNKTYLDQLYEHFKLVGYSSNDLEVLRNIDRDIQNESKFISGIRFKSDGDFYSYTYKKVISRKAFKKLLEITKQKIDESINNILQGNFVINPKKIEKKFDSCEFCQYKDVCYRDITNYVKLRDYQDFEFIGGEDDSN